MRHSNSLRSLACNHTLRAQALTLLSTSLPMPQNHSHLLTFKHVEQIRSCSPTFSYLPLPSKRGPHYQYINERPQEPPHLVVDIGWYCAAA